MILGDIKISKGRGKEEMEWGYMFLIYDDGGGGGGGSGRWIRIWYIGSVR